MNHINSTQNSYQPASQACKEDLKIYQPKAKAASGLRMGTMYSPDCPIVMYQYLALKSTLFPKFVMSVPPEHNSFCIK